MPILFNILLASSIIIIASISLSTADPIVDEDYLTVVLNASNTDALSSTTTKLVYNENEDEIDQMNGLTPKTKQQIVQFIRSQMKKETRKLKSTITDSVMEEMINYYGKKLEMGDQMKQELDLVNKKVATLTQNLNSLGQNFKSISKNHRNLVDIVRSNLISLRKEKEAEKTKSSSTNTRALANNEHNGSFKRKTTNPDKMMSSVSHASPNNEYQTDDARKLVIRQDPSEKNSKKIQMVLLENSQNKEIIETTSTSTTTTTTLQTAYPSSKIMSILNDEIVNKSPKDCQDVTEQGDFPNGVFKITASNLTFDVYCEFENSEEFGKVATGWTVLQNRYDGSVNFNENWKSYKNGFGNLANGGEFWLGLDYMNALTSQEDYSLQIILSDWKNNKYVANYDHFKVDNEQTKYRLELTDYVKETSSAGDSFGDSLNPTQSHNMMSFSTYDSDNDLRFYDNCAQIFKSGWWFNACFQSNLNGIYYNLSANEHHSQHPNGNKLRSAKQDESNLRFLRNGIHWNSIDFYKSLKSTKLRIKRKSLNAKN